MPRGDNAAHTYQLYQHIYERLNLYFQLLWQSDIHLLISNNPYCAHTLCSGVTWTRSDTDIVHWKRGVPTLHRSFWRELQLTQGQDGMRWKMLAGHSDPVFCAAARQQPSSMFGDPGAPQTFTEHSLCQSSVFPATEQDISKVGSGRGEGPAGGQGVWPCPGASFIFRLQWRPQGFHRACGCDRASTCTAHWEINLSVSDNQKLQ